MRHIDDELKNLSLADLVERTKQQYYEDLNNGVFKEHIPFSYEQRDIAGYWYNAKYPPDKKRYGTRYDGYPSDAACILFYNFAIQGYDVSFRYKGQMHYLMYDKGHASVCDDHFTKEYITFPDPNTLIEQYEIDGTKLIDIIDELEEVEAV